MMGRGAEFWRAADERINARLEPFIRPVDAKVIEIVGSKARVAFPGESEDPLVNTRPEYPVIGAIPTVGQQALVLANFAGGWIITSGGLSSADRTKLDAVRPNDAKCDLTRSSHQPGIQHATWTPVYWNSEIADPRNWHSLTANAERVTFDAAGFYLVTFYQRWASPSSSGVRYLRGLLNGSIVFEDSVSAAVDSVGRVPASRMFQASAGDYFQIEVNQTSGGPLDLHSVSGLAVARIL